MHEGSYKRDLKFDLFATQRGRGRQSRDLVKRAPKLFDRLNQGGARCGPLPRLTPQTSGFFNQASPCAVPRHNLRLVFSNIHESAFESFGDAGM